jgi:hypothetical protein
VAGDLADAVALLEGLHQHFLLDRRQVGRQAEFAADVPANGAKPFWLSVSRTFQR